MEQRHAPAPGPAPGDESRDSAQPGRGAALPPTIRLANDIAAQFRHLPEPDAVTAIAGHLRSFWDPRMRAQLLVQVDAVAPELDPLVLAAAQRLR